MDVTKYFLSETMKESDPLALGWSNSVLLNNLVDIKKLKNTEGADLKVWGSSKLVQILLKNDLVDELWLNIYPLTLGAGKKLFDSTAIPAAFSLVKGVITPSGVIIANYKRAGAVRTGTVGA